MFKKFVIILIIMFSISINVSAMDATNIEIFDITKGCVIKKMESNASIQNKAENYIKGITGVYAKFNPIPTNGYMIEVPFDTPIMIQNQWINAFVEEVIIILPEQDNPYLMVFDNKDRILFFNFQGNTDELLESLNKNL